MGLRPLAGWDSAFESCWGLTLLSIVSVVCGPVEFSATGRSIVPKNRTECSVSECNLEISVMRRPRLTKAVKPWGRNGVYLRLSPFYGSHADIFSL